MFIRITDRVCEPAAGVIRSQRIREVPQERRPATAKLSSLPDVEWALLTACASPDWDFPQDASIPQLIAEQVCIQPDAVALTVDGVELTYAELWTRSGVIAARLRGTGVRRGHMVGLCCERSPELVVGMLGILRSGAAYVPLDPSYSAERLTFMRKDIGLRVIVAQAATRLPDGVYRTIVVDSRPAQLCDPEQSGLLEDDPWAAGPDDLAYLSYQSGPDGSGAPTVMASHRNVLSLLAGTRRFG